MLTKTELLADKTLLRDKAYGAMIGLAIGDSLGDAARKQENRENYGFTTDFTSGASWSTDDTEFALLTAQILIDSGGKPNTRDVVDAWMKHVVCHDELNRGGASEREASANLRRGILPPFSGKYNAFGFSDGACMRIAPVGIICAGEPDKAAEIARVDAELSHYRDGVWGAQAVAAAVAVAMMDATMDEIWAAAMRYIPEDSWLHFAMTTAQCIVKDNNGEVLSAWMPLHDALRTSSWAATPEAIPGAFACLLMQHGDFKKGLVLAGNFARDADTIGAVAGAILGAKYGAAGIPDAWKEKSRYPTGTCLAFTKGIDIYKMSRKLADLIQ